jgi:hypothetical protein
VATPKVLLLITVLVAITPLTFVVSTLPLRLSVSELIILVKTDCIPFTNVENVLVVVLNVFELMILDVAKTPLVVLLNVFTDELNVLVVDEASKLEKLPMTAFAIVVVPSKERLVNPFIVVVEVIPFTVLVIKLVVDEKLRLLVVVAAIRLAREVVEITPFTLLVINPVLVAKVTLLLDTIDVVAVTPFTTLVKILPVTDWVNELIILVNAD